MKIDAHELEQLAATQNRLDMYAGIHKAVRAFLADTLMAVGRLDAADAQDLAAACARVRDLLGFCEAHLRHENDFVHPAIEARSAGGSATIAGEHRDHERHIAQLRGAVQALESACPAMRQAHATQLYRELALFTADNLQHMHVEETAHNALLWAAYTDAELAAIHDALVASIAPAEMMAVARWMLPFMNPAERLAVLSDIRGKAPIEAFDAILGVVRPQLRDDEWAKLARGLGIAPVPGLVGA